MNMKTIPIDEFHNKGKNIVFKHGPKQILLIGVEDKIFALDNRCPHEGYPLSEGTTDGKSCLLTCNWHNWKFDLKSGKCVLGADNVTTYPVEVKGEEIHIDIREPDIEEVRDSIMEGFSVSLKKRDAGRMSRELARLAYNKIDPLFAVKHSLLWSYQKFEFGMTHAYAALADWLGLYLKEENLEEQIICLTEGLNGIATDALRHKDYPFAQDDLEYSEAALKKAVEEENASLAESLAFAGLKSGLRFKDFERILAEMALGHYSGFGHDAIYVYKASQVVDILQDREVDKAMVLSLIRSFVYTTREDLIPDFKGYGDTLEELANLDFGTGGSVDKESLRGKRVKEGYRWLTENLPKASCQALYNALLELNGDNFLRYDLKYQEAVHASVTQSVGWLSFTHAMTFSNAVRVLCTRYPDLWKKGLLQMVCFYGRNTAYLDQTVDLNDWTPKESEGTFFEKVKSILFDHGMVAPILSAHLIKTSVAIFEEVSKAQEETKSVLLGALNRFLNSPLKQNQVRRRVYQAINLVKKDFE